MDAVAVIAECNPFHLGHRYLFSSIRKQFPASPLIVILSGDYVQRGEFAIADKYLRAKTLIGEDVDLVLELPFPYSTLSAEGFARAGVSIAASIGCVSHLAFACEYPDLDLLSRAAALLASPDFEAAFAEKIKENPGLPYPALREEVFYGISGGFPRDLLRSPNCILALSYIMALRDTALKPIVFPRLSGASEEVADVSGQKLRSRILAGDASWKASVPSHTHCVFDRALADGRFPVLPHAAEQAILYTLRNTALDAVAACYGCAPLAHRIKRAADVSTSLSMLYQKVSASQYPMSRIRRSVLAATLGVTEESTRHAPAFSLVLAANQTGRRLMREIKKSTALPIYTKPAHAWRDGVLSPAYSRAEELFGLAFPAPCEKNWYLKMTPCVREV